MREFPVFVPHGREWLAAVITVPDQEPRGLVLLLTGTGAPRSHRYQVWTRLARQLAEDGLASVRMDREGIGDSTGQLQAHRLNEALLHQAMAVARFAMQATGTDRIGVAGNCSGSRMALYIAASLPTCVSTVCVLPRVLEPGGVHRLVVTARRSKVASFFRTSKLLHRLTEPLRHRRGRVSSAMEGYFSRALEHSRVLFVYTKEDPDAYNVASLGVLKRILARLSPQARARFELRVLPNGPLVGFESLGIQEDAIRTVRTWLADGFDRAEASEASVR
jgi:dienelactone hydrolase